MLSEYVNCRWHLAKNLREALVEDIVELDLRSRSKAAKAATALEHPLVKDFEGAFSSAQAYRAFRDRVTEEVGFAQLRLRQEDCKITGSRRWLRASARRSL